MDKSIITASQKMLCDQVNNSIQDYISYLKRERWSIKSRESSFARQTIIELEDLLMNHYKEYEKLYHILQSKSEDFMLDNFKNLREQFTSLVTKGIRSLLCEMCPTFTQQPPKIKKPQAVDELMFSEIVYLEEKYGRATAIPLGFRALTHTGRSAVVNYGNKGKIWTLSNPSTPKSNRRGAKSPANIPISPLENLAGQVYTVDSGSTSTFTHSSPSTF